MDNLPEPILTKVQFWHRLSELKPDGPKRKFWQTGYRVAWPVFPFDTFDCIIAHSTTRRSLDDALAISPRWMLYMECTGGSLTSVGIHKTKQHLLDSCLIDGVPRMRPDNSAFDPANLIKHAGLLAQADIVTLEN